jgi:hypothetical protein
VVSITVVLPAPSQLVYPQTTIYATPGISITPLTPSVSGTVKSYSSSPSLPAGLTLDQTTGTISGTPTVAAPKTTYTISASNSGGSATAQLTITVAAAPTVLLELGHGAAVSAVQLASDRLLSLDVSGHWVLWGYSTAAILASGDGATGLINNPNQGPVAGQFFAVSTATQIQLYATTDGHSLASIPFSVTQGQSWSQIASDGSYLCAGNATGAYCRGRLSHGLTLCGAGTGSNCGRTGGSQRHPDHFRSFRGLLDDPTVFRRLQLLVS